MEFFSEKKISTQIQKKIHKSKIQAFQNFLKTLLYFFNISKYQILVLTNYNHLYQFTNIKKSNLIKTQFDEKIYK